MPLNLPVMHQKIKIIFEEQPPQRLDKFLSELRIQELYSRSFIEKLIDEDRILVNLIPVKKSYILQKNDEIDISLPEQTVHQIQPQEIPLDIVYEDNDLAIINKESGMIVHPGFGNPEGTLVNAILHHWGENLSSGRAADRPGIVHRLDRGTSGLLIIAKNDLTQSRLNDLFAHRQIEKTYLAISSGIPDEPEGMIANNIARSLTNPRKMCVASEGRHAITHYKIIYHFHYFALHKILLETGRMHQIRVHFAHLGFPLLGDLLYNTRAQVHNIIPSNMKKKATELLTTHLRRQALHAWRLQFVHPISGRQIDAFAPLPEDFLYALKWLDQNFAIDKSCLDPETILSDNIKW